MKPYLRILGLSSFFAALIIFLKYLSPVLVNDYSWYALIFVSSLSLINHFLVNWLSRKNASGFLLFFFISMFIRFTLSILFIFICVKKSEVNEKLFVASFFVIYFIFLGFEIWGIMGNLRPHLKSKKN